jgi:hypothetical protein
MTTWNTLADMASSLRLRSSVSNLESLRKEIKKKMASLHPDRNGGKFKSEKSQQRYHELTSALEFIDSMKQSTALVPVNQYAEIVKAVVDALESPKERRLAETKAEYRKDAANETVARYRLPMISSGAFSTLFVFLLSFPSTFKDNPLFHFFVATQIGLYVTGYLLFCSAGMFLWSRLSEYRDKEWVDFLSTDEGGKNILGSVILFSKSESSSNGIKFTFDEFVKAIGSRLHNSLPRLPFRSKFLSLQATEKLASYHLQQFESRKIIRRVEENAIDTVYQIDSEVARMVRNKYPYR